MWNLTCETPDCTGIPLYREYQTGTEHAAPTPTGQSTPTTQFIRMAGEGVGQRSSLTINNGSYYVDTTTLETGPASSNPFVGGNTYDVFFIFAKQETQQTYQMYVGPNLGSNFPANNVSAIRVLIGTGNVPFNQTSSAWPQNWTRTYDSTSGLLTVTTDMSGFSDLIGYYPPMAASAKTGLCQPSTFCSWNASGNSCGCSANSLDYPILTTDPNFWNECDSVCQTWAVKDLDCPTGGCYGFSVTFPAGFNATPSTNPLPTPNCFPEDADWTRPFDNSAGFDPADQEVGGACYYSSTPPSDFCPSTDMASLNRRF